MITPSLVSMVLHSVWATSEHLRSDKSYAGMGELIDRLHESLQRFPSPTNPEIPVVARTSNPATALDYFGDRIRISHSDSPAGSFFWGRLPVDLLVGFMRDRKEVAAKQEYVDLGTRVKRQSSGGTLVSDCQSLIKNAATGTVAVTVAMVDSGKTVHGSSPEDFGGKLVHARTTDLEMSDHALAVLKILLERLDGHGKISQTRFLASLFTPPTAPVGSTCFKHAGAVELLDALDDLLLAIKKHSEPAVITMSLGTHVGPHNGDSPLEEYIASHFSPSSSRYFHAAAGNDGLSGIAGRLELTADLRDFLRLQTGPSHGPELLVEFWWEEITGAALSIAAAVSERSGKPVFATPVRINSSRPKTTMTRAAASPTGVLCETLMHARCKGNMNCAALALSNAGGAALPTLDIEFTLESTVDITVGAWIVVGGGSQSAFIEGGSSGTICVPASAPEVLCVSGITGTNKPWARSSRGPVGDYGSHTPVSAPRLAHLVQYRRGGRMGTSYACPRAAADAANVLSPPLAAKCATLDDLAREVFSVAKLPAWNPRTGYGEIDK
ncbi:hypothetical protein SAMN05444166_2611 [Singulisphaera sp. GP187]|uniref:hypothetical protein n=1 Tax=Singulisphaera sp. GP187 TaxID=1882752 RepID=UPI000926E36F|nr:hypothetical protein [Singulisphaera sp. GP187]SIO13000.1 hypothetical protein SAMN05444166_2611 [Singulisphaera sp. GP187]